MILQKEFLALADIKAFNGMYSQITAASDWLRLFAPYMFLFSISLLFVISACNVLSSLVCICGISLLMAVFNYS